MVLSILLIIFLLEIYQMSQRNFKFQHKLNMMQDNAIIALDILRTDIKKAGYIGCARLTDDFPVYASATFLITPQNKLSGTDTAIIVRHAAFAGVQLKEMVDASTLYVTNEEHLSSGNTLILSDCAHIEIFQAEKIFANKDRQKIITSHALHTYFSPLSEVDELIENRYFVAKTNRVNRVGLPIFALYVENNKHQKLELVDGIDDLQFFYSVNLSGKITDFPAKEINDWSKVVGVSIRLKTKNYSKYNDWYAYVSLS